MKSFKRWKNNRRKTHFDVETINLEIHKGTAGENTRGQFGETRYSRGEINVLNTALYNEVDPFCDTIHGIVRTKNLMIMVRKIKSEILNGKCGISEEQNGIYEMDKAKISVLVCKYSVT
jgi:hypothetical protein